MQAFRLHVQHAMLHPCLHAPCHAFCMQCSITCIMHAIVLHDGMPCVQHDCSKYGFMLDCALHACGMQHDKHHASLRSGSMCMACMQHAMLHDMHHACHHAPCACHACMHAACNMTCISQTTTYKSWRSTNGIWTVILQAGMLLEPVGLHACLLLE